MSYAAGEPPYRASDRISEPTAPTRGPSTLAMAVFGFFALVLWLGVGFQLLFIVPRFEKMFLDFKMRLPLTTEWSFTMSRAFWRLAPACLIAFLVCIVPRSRWAGLSRWAALILIVLLPLLLNLFIIASLYFPYADLVEALGGNAPQF